MKKIFLSIVSAGFVLFYWAGIAMAIPITITSYDILSTFSSGYGAWHNTYNGTITNIGNNTSFYPNTDLYNYTNGSGTLNDGLVGIGHLDGIGIVEAHLFSETIFGSLTIYFDDYYTINTIQLLSWGPESSNEGAGSIAGVDITINGNTQYFNTSGFGPWNSASAGCPAHDHIDVSTSSLNNYLVNQVTFSNFITENTSGPYFGISEIIVDDEILALPPIIYPGPDPSNPIPEPATVLLFGAVLVWMVGIEIRKRNVRK